MTTNRNDKCWCGSGFKYKKCHLDCDENYNEMAAIGHIMPPKSLIKNKEQIEAIKESGKINTGVLDEVAKHIKAGMSTADIDKIVYDYTIAHGATPAPLGYGGFPKSVCTSINSEVCHGIPDENIILKEGDIVNVDVSTIKDGYFSDASRMFKIGKVSEAAGIPDENIILKEGDIVNVDVSTIKDGYFSDASRMFKIGKVSEAADKITDVAKECLEAGIKAVKPWGHLGDIGAAVQELAEKNGYSVVRAFGGHGIGLELEKLVKQLIK